MDPVSCVSCVSWMHSVYAAETHETFHQESGMRYQHLSEAPIHHARIGAFSMATASVIPLSVPLPWPDSA